MGERTAVVGGAGENRSLQLSCMAKGDFSYSVSLVWMRKGTGD